MKHKHADLIHAWADGAEIQSRFSLSQQTAEGYNWEEDKYPTWASNRDYRIKPEEKKPVVRWLWVTRLKQDDGTFFWEPESTFMSEEEAADCWCNDSIKLEWSRTEFPE